MKKLYEIGAKTGINTNEINKMLRFGVFGLIAVAFTALTSCFKNNDTPVETAQPQNETEPLVVPDAAPTTIQDLVDTLDKSTDTAQPNTAKPKPSVNKNCGPHPGYPCGTKYYTVSAADIKGAI